MLTVILAAGKSRRFKDNGWPKTKTVVPMPDGRTLLEWQLDRIAPEKLLFFSREEYRQHEHKVLVRARWCSRPHFWLHPFWEHRETLGPLDYLWRKRTALDISEELLICYNDELIETKSLNLMVQMARMYDRGAVIAALETDDLRFTRIPDEPDWGAACTYYFRSGKEFVKHMETIEDRGPEVGVPSVVYSYPDWSPFLVPKDDIVELGTADEYKSWMAEQGCPVKDW